MYNIVYVLVYMLCMFNSIGLKLIPSGLKLRTSTLPRLARGVTASQEAASLENHEKMLIKPSKRRQHSGLEQVVDELMPPNAPCHVFMAYPGLPRFGPSQLGKPYAFSDASWHQR